MNRTEWILDLAGNILVASMAVIVIWEIANWYLNRNKKQRR